MDAVFNRKPGFSTLNKVNFKNCSLIRHLDDLLSAHSIACNETWVRLNARKHIITGYRGLFFNRRSSLSKINLIA